MKKASINDIFKAQRTIIQKIALGADLADCLNEICLAIEKQFAQVQALTSILVLEGQHLHHCASPQLPKAYTDAIDGIQYGPNVGSCGTAAFTGKQVIVCDIATDPLWKDYKELALAHNLRACWSTPIISSDNKVLGSFAVYYTEIKAPTQNDLDLIEHFTYLSGVAIEKQRAQQREQQLIDELYSSSEKLRAFTSVIPDLAIVLDEHGTYVDFYGADMGLLLDKPDLMRGKKVTDILYSEEVDQIMGVIRSALSSDHVQQFEYTLNVVKGERVFEGRAATIKNYSPEHPERRHVLWMARDITDRKFNDQQIEKLAFFDPLTSLPNRRLLTDRLQLALNQSARHDRVGAILFFDLDKFKRINDTLGHVVGDQLLIQVADRLKPLLRASDTIARIGGDEFIIILSNVQKDAKSMAEEARAVANKVLGSFSKPFILDTREHNIGASIGICLIEDNSLSADEILHRADTAMYQSKGSGGNQYFFYDSDLQSVTDHRLQL